MISSAHISKIMANTETADIAVMLDSRAWQPLMWGTETSLRQPAVEKCYSSFVTELFLSRGGLCWNPAVPHIVYQALCTPGHPNTVFILFCKHSLSLACSCLVEHNLWKHWLYIMSWCDTGATHGSQWILHPWNQVLWRGVTTRTAQNKNVCLLDFNIWPVVILKY